MDSRNIIEQHQSKVVAWVTMVGAVLAFPFAINCFISGRWSLGCVCMSVLGLFVYNATPAQRVRRNAPGRLLLVPGIGLCLALCFFELGVTGAFWSYPAITLFYFILPQKHARWTNAFLLAVIVPSAYYTLPMNIVFRISATVTMVSMSSAIFVYLISLQHQELLRMAIVDPLTQVFNRSHLSTSLSNAEAREKRFGTPMTIISLDIDHFKSVNDQFGHATGDWVLQRLVGVLTERLRESDQIFRLGGEEFLVLLEGTSHKQGLTVAEELRVLISQEDILPDRSVTASMGVAELVRGEGIDHWLKRGDQRMYLAKQSGRNKVIGNAEW